MSNKEKPRPIRVIREPAPGGGVTFTLDEIVRLEPTQGLCLIHREACGTRIAEDPGKAPGRP